MRLLSKSSGWRVEKNYTFKKIVIALYYYYFTRPGRHGDRSEKAVLKIFGMPKNSGNNVDLIRLRRQSVSSHVSTTGISELV